MDEPDDEYDDYDYRDRYTPPKLGYVVLTPDPDVCKEQIAELRKRMLNPELDRYDLDELAQKLAHFVASSGDLGSRIEETKAGIPYKDEVLAHAMMAEHDALLEAQTLKKLTASRFGTTSGSMAVAAMLNHAVYKKPIDMLELQNQMEAQMKSMADSGAGRRDKMEMLALQAEQAGQALMIESASAVTREPKALILKSASSSFATAAKITEQLHNLSEPTGTIVDGHSIEDKQLSNETKKLKAKE